MYIAQTRNKLFALSFYNISLVHFLVIYISSSFVISRSRAKALDIKTTLLEASPL